MLNKVKEFQYDILIKRNTVLVTFAITDMFYISIMFLMNFMPSTLVLSLAILAGTIISGIVMSKIVSTPGKEAGEAIAEKLCYFPVVKKYVRKAQYGQLIKITLIQVGMTCIPILVTCFRFHLKNTCMALFGTMVSMLLFGSFLIEINLSTFRRK